MVSKDVDVDISNFPFINYKLFYNIENCGFARFVGISTNKVKPFIWVKYDG